MARTNRLRADDRLLLLLLSVAVPLVDDDWCWRVPDAATAAEGDAAPVAAVVPVAVAVAVRRRDASVPASALVVTDAVTLTFARNSTLAEGSTNFSKIQHADCKRLVRPVRLEDKTW